MYCNVCCPGALSDDLLAELGGELANISSPIELKPSVRAVMLPRLVMRHLQAKCEARRIDQRSPDQPRTADDAMRCLFVKRRLNLQSVSPAFWMGTENKNTVDIDLASISYSVSNQVRVMVTENSTLFGKRWFGPTNAAFDAGHILRRKSPLHKRVLAF
ncbi:hypothetical protein T265_01100 [Opisthorchis viverrini]|uniref:Uncharacterized protein n=1 Tax=Opisthorchis viverrini TaxID=6198 RepID=A0A075A0X6_OPIVI|nr:hypothetical protein T265_01100 [Opisthorchis viverrini]KER33021.1 hypothetical protein T265_01100 [Opisthorchis viverrini]